MDAFDLVLRSRRVVLDGSVVPASIHVHRGRIAAISVYDDFPTNTLEQFDAGDDMVMPGLVDTHVHINEPGRTEWEGFQTATRAAAAGGITTLVEMPLNSIPATTTLEAYRTKCAAAESQLWVDTGFWGGVVPGNVAELQPLWEAGVFGFKCFLVPSGVPEFEHVTEAGLRAALPELARLGAPLLAHSELPGPLERVAAETAGASSRAHATWLHSRPRAAENEAIELLLRLSHEFDARVHIVHLSSSDALPLLRSAKSAGTRVSVESCPHYLYFAAEEIPDGATEYKCAPPIRERANREQLWAALREGLIEMIVSDHSPAPPEMKCRETGDFLRAWGGIASLQLGLSVIWTVARERGFSIAEIVRWMAERPARLAGLKTKGALRPELDADFVVFDPEAAFRVNAQQLEHRHKLTPYDGRELRGAVRTTFLRGRKIFDGKTFLGPCGRILKRGES
jgi:allantoinase